MALNTQEQILLAARVAARAHAGHKRKDGTPYIAHCMRVAFRISDQISPAVYKLHEPAQAAALLHDTVEDTDVTLDELRELGFSPEVVEAVDSVTRRAGETYADFIVRASKSELGRAIKVADIEDNLEDQSALDPEEAEFLRKRYTKALDVLNGQLDN